MKNLDKNLNDYQLLDTFSKETNSKFLDLENHSNKISFLPNQFPAPPKKALLAR